MNNVVLVQARMGSSRLPNKVLKEISGKPDIQWVIERVQRSKLINEVVVVTSIEKENLPLINLCTKLGIRVFVGSEKDVLDRYYQAAKLVNPQNVIRVTGDCPLFDWRYLDKAIEVFEEDSDYLWMGENGFPDGLDLEIMTFASLRTAWEQANLKSEREHVTLYVRNHPDKFKIQTFDFPIKGKGYLRWTLDEEEDYKMISKVYDFFVKKGKEDFVTEDILGFLDNHPEVEKINCMFARNEGLARSIKEDEVIDHE